MPSGARKRKAAKRKKEMREKGVEKKEETGSIPHPPLSPSNNPLPFPPSPPQPQGHGHEDRMSYDDGRLSEDGEFETPSETPFATPLSQANHPLAERSGEEIPGSQRAAFNSAVEGYENGNGEADKLAQRLYELANDDAGELEGETVPAVADDSSVGIVQSEVGRPCEAEGAGGTEMEKSAEESVIAVEQSVLTREEVKQEKKLVAPAVISQNCELNLVALPAKGEIKEQPSYEREVKVVPLPSEEEVGEAASYECEVRVVRIPDEDDVRNRPSYECEVKVAPEPDEDEVKERPSHEHDANIMPPLDKDEVKEQPYHEREGKVVAALQDEDKVKKQPSHERQMKVVRLSDEDATGEQFCVSEAETVPSTKVVPCTPVVVHRVRWWNCCGLLDVLMGSER